jgi:hypothetical protein
VRLQSHFIDNIDSCLGSSTDCYRPSCTLLFRGPSSLSGFSAPWRLGTFLRPLRGPPGLPHKKDRPVKRHLSRSSKTTRTEFN